MRHLRNSKGFTLIELMIVVVIIGILAALAIPRFSKASARAKEKEADGILTPVYTLQQTYKAQNGAYATAVTDLEKVGFEAPTTLKNYTWAGDASVADGACLAKSPATATHNSRSISFTTGVISSSTASGIPKVSAVERCFSSTARLSLGGMVTSLMTSSP